MQEDFVNGVFGSDAAKAIVPYVIEQAHSDKYDCVIFTRDWHNPISEEEFMENKLLPPSLCSKHQGCRIC